MVKYDLKIESANITAQKNYYNSFYDYYFDFQFAIDGWVSSDKALEIGTKAVSDFSDWTAEKNFSVNPGIYYNFSKRSFVKMGKVYNPLFLSKWVPLRNKVFTFNKAGLKPKKAGFNDYITVYGIDGSPFKGIVFCTASGNYGNQSNHSGQYTFLFTDRLDSIIGKMTINIPAGELRVELDYEHQMARYGDCKATPQNIFNVSMSPIVSSRQDEKEYSIVPPRSEKFNSVTIKTVSYGTSYDNKRYDMSIDIPSALGQMDNVRIEAQKAFAEQVEKYMGDDIKWRLHGLVDTFSLEYAPIDTIGDAFELAKSISSSANDLVK